MQGKRHLRRLSDDFFRGIFFGCLYSLILDGVSFAFSDDSLKYSNIIVCLRSTATPPVRTPKKKPSEKKARNSNS